MKDKKRKTTERVLRRLTRAKSKSELKRMGKDPIKQIIYESLKNHQSPQEDAHHTTEQVEAGTPPREAGLIFDSAKFEMIADSCCDEASEYGKLRNIRRVYKELSDWNLDSLNSGKDDDGEAYGKPNDFHNNEYAIIKESDILVPHYRIPSSFFDLVSQKWWHINGWRFNISPELASVEHAQKFLHEKRVAPSSIKELFSKSKSNSILFIQPSKEERTDKCPHIEEDNFLPPEVLISYFKPEEIKSMLESNKVKTVENGVPAEYFQRAEKFKGEYDYADVEFCLVISFGINNPNPHSEYMTITEVFTSEQQILDYFDICLDKKMEECNALIHGTHYYSKEGKGRTSYSTLGGYNNLVDVVCYYLALLHYASTPEIKHKLGSQRRSQVKKGSDIIKPDMRNEVDLVILPETKYEYETKPTSSNYNQTNRKQSPHNRIGYWRYNPKTKIKDIRVKPAKIKGGAKKREAVIKKR